MTLSFLLKSSGRNAGNNYSVRMKMVGIQKTNISEISKMSNICKQWLIWRVIMHVWYRDIWVFYYSHVLKHTTWLSLVPEELYTSEWSTRITREKYKETLTSECQHSGCFRLAGKLNFWGRLWLEYQSICPPFLSCLKRKEVWNFRN